MPASLLAGDLKIDGALVSTGDLHIEGVVLGDVTGVRVTLGETGRIEGDIQADSIDVRGQILGSINARQVRLAASGHVEGDITHEQLSVEAGAYFQGRSLKQPSPEAPASAELVMISSSARQA